MRAPRREQLQSGDLVHTTWRGHNREWIFRTEKDKETYLRSLVEASSSSDFEVNAACLMKNHEHTVGGVQTVEGYSSFFQQAHGKYAQQYNRARGREGAVGSGRPKSTVIADERHWTNAIFYVDANPVRAGVVKHPRDYRWSSHRFYAYGEESLWTRLLTVPQWYRDLGRTPALRRRAYRRLCDAYLRREGLLPDPGQPAGFYAGALRPVTDAASGRPVKGGEPAPREVGRGQAAGADARPAPGRDAGLEDTS